MLRRLVPAIVVAALGPAVARADDGAPAAGAAKAAVFSHQKTVTTGGMKLSWPRHAKILGRTPFTIPVSMVPKHGRRTVETTLTRNGEHRPAVRVKQPLDYSLMLTMTLPRSMRAGVYVLRITVAKGRHQVGHVRSTIRVS
jgi:hypothetical protein